MLQRSGPRFKRSSLPTGLALAVVSAVLCVSAIPAQTPRTSTLPASAPTTGISPSQLPSANPAVQSNSQSSSHSQVSWDGHLLQVNATDASLNRILQEIGQKANLQITGSAPEEKVFGTYGPGNMEDVLSDLLDGSSVNMVFVDRPGSQAKQLLLTARTGGPMNSSTPNQNIAPDTAQGIATQYQPESQTYRNNGSSLPQPAEQTQNDRPQYTPQPTPVTSENPATSSDAPTSGTRTPQQIFEQLQRLRQQRQ